jgi:aminocarboxymuconate-semialdehyde decarboxylase
MPIVDIHTHVYPPSFVSRNYPHRFSSRRNPLTPPPVLKSRTEVPKIRSFENNPISRLIILPGEDDPSNPSTSQGRPIGPEYYDIAQKISFMDAHGIDISVISQANPWLDFLPSSEAATAAREINDDIESMCDKYPGRLFAFGTLPMSAGTEACVEEVRRLRGLESMRGVVFGTTGMGKGLDDERMEGLWRALEETEMTVFLHPHYGLPKEVYGPRADEYGHVLALALG